jgi:hypothetical protein
VKGVENSESGLCPKGSKSGRGMCGVQTREIRTKSKKKGHRHTHRTRPNMKKDKRKIRKKIEGEKIVKWGGVDATPKNLPTMVDEFPTRPQAS